MCVQIFCCAAGVSFCTLSPLHQGCPTSNNRRATLINIFIKKWKLIYYLQVTTFVTLYWNCHIVFCRYIMFVKFCYRNCSNDWGPHVGIPALDHRNPLVSGPLNNHPLQESSRSNSDTKFVLLPITVLQQLNYWVLVNLINIPFGGKNILVWVRGVVLHEGLWPSMHSVLYVWDLSNTNNISVKAFFCGSDILLFVQKSL